MQREAAIKLIRDTFERPFNKEQFTRFVKNLLNRIEDAPFTYRGNLIFDDFKDQVQSLERIGKYQDDDGNKIDILVVHLVRETTLERARASQRKFVAKYLKGSRGGELKDAALVAFVSPDDNDWRFSIVKMEYKLDQLKGKVVEEFTPARRYSFLVGANENSHTAQSRLLPILQDTEHDPSLKVLEGAFSVEKVTQEFFEQYRSLFLEIKDGIEGLLKKDKDLRHDFQSKGVEEVDFAKKLLGQIVFLYFLQKKGWFGVARNEDWGTGPRNFLRLLFDGSVTKFDNFFNDVLEPLFYEALAVEREADYYSKFRCKIPFLNGGLFDPLNNYDWVHTDIMLPNALFSNTAKTKAGDIGTGILDVFDRYNFTVKEDEPLEKEVAVDPEMLGKVFENLLEVNDRKSKGTYYTPREIVHSMCQESLINYLSHRLSDEVTQPDIETLVKHGETSSENDARVLEAGRETSTYSFKLPEFVRDKADVVDTALAEIKVCDPAVGSGAFLVGMMTEIVRARLVIAPFLNNPGTKASYELKRHAIQSSLYGVDIEPSSVEIAKLRLWLSLVVDEEDYRRIRPLPNLDYKIMQGDSLLEEFEGIKLVDENLLDLQEVKAVAIDRLRTLQNQRQAEYIELHQRDELSSIKKAEIEKQLKDIRKQLQELESPEAREQDSLFDSRIVKRKAERLRELHTLYLDAYQKQTKDRLRTEIDSLTWEIIEASLRHEGKEKKLEEVKRLQKTNVKPFFLWRLNFSEVFRNAGGFDVVIANPPYVSFGLRGTEKASTDWAAVIRTTYPNSAEYKLSLYAIFMDRGLQLLVNKGCICYITPDSFLLGRYFSKLRSHIINCCSIKRLTMFEGDFWKAGVVGRPVISLIQLDKFATDRSSNKVLVTLCKDLDALQNGAGSFAYNQDHFERTKYNRFRLLFSQRALDFIEAVELRSVPLGDLARITTGVRSKIGQKNIVSEKKQGDLWKKGIISGSQVLPFKTNWEGHYLRIDGSVLWAGGWDKNVIERPKLLIRQTSDSLVVSIDKEGLYHLNNAHSLTLKNDKIVKLEFLCALLNSRLMNRYYHLISLEKGRTMAQTDIETLETLPVRLPSLEVQVEIASIAMDLSKDKSGMYSFEQALWDAYELPKKLRIYLAASELY